MSLLKCQKEISEIMKDFHKCIGDDFSEKKEDKPESLSQ